MNAMTLDKAIVVAAEGHEGQVDKHGVPMILHALRVMLAVAAQDRIAAVLHDICEDTKFTLDDLRAGGLSTGDADVVDAMTRREGEQYFDYIRRVSQHRRARVVKCLDIEDNMRLERRIESLMPRYQKALRRLWDAIQHDKENDNAEN